MKLSLLVCLIFAFFVAGCGQSKVEFKKSEAPASTSSSTADSKQTEGSVKPGDVVVAGESAKAGDVVKAEVPAKSAPGTGVEAKPSTPATPTELPKAPVPVPAPDAVDASRYIRAR